MGGPEPISRLPGIVVAQAGPSGGEQKRDETVFGRTNPYIMLANNQDRAFFKDYSGRIQSGDWHAIRAFLPFKGPDFRRFVEEPLGGRPQSQFFLQDCYNVFEVRIWGDRTGYMKKFRAGDAGAGEWIFELCQAVFNGLKALRTLIYDDALWEAQINPANYNASTEPELYSAMEYAYARREDYKKEFQRLAQFWNVRGAETLGSYYQILADRSSGSQKETYLKKAAEFYEAVLMGGSVSFEGTAFSINCGMSRSFNSMTTNHTKIWSAISLAWIKYELGETAEAEAIFKALSDKTRLQPATQTRGHATGGKIIRYTRQSSVADVITNNLSFSLYSNQDARRMLYDAYKGLILCRYKSGDYNGVTQAFTDLLNNRTYMDNTYYGNTAGYRIQSNPYNLSASQYRELFKYVIKALRKNSQTAKADELEVLAGSGRDVQAAEILDILGVAVTDVIANFEIDFTGYVQAAPVDDSRVVAPNQQEMARLTADIPVLRAKILPYRTAGTPEYKSIYPEIGEALRATHGGTSERFVVDDGPDGVKGQYLVRPSDVPSSLSPMAKEYLRLVWELSQAIEKLEGQESLEVAYRPSLLSQAEGELRSRQYDRAIVTVSRVKNPDAAQAIQIKIITASAKAGLGQYSEAERLFKEVMGGSLDVRSRVRVILALVNVFEKQGRFAQVETVVAEQIEAITTPRDRNALILAKARALEAQHKYALAVIEYNKVRTNEAKLGAARCQMALVLQDIASGDKDAAIRKLALVGVSLDAITGRDATKIPYLLTRAQFYNVRAQLTKARFGDAKSDEINADYEASNDIYLRLLGTRNIESQLTRYDITKADLVRWYANNLMAQGKFMAAMQAFEYYGVEASSEVQLGYIQARAGIDLAGKDTYIQMLGKIETAIIDKITALDVSGNEQIIVNLYSNLAWLYSIRASIYEKTGDFNKAYENYQKAEEIYAYLLGKKATLELIPAEIREKISQVKSAASSLDTYHILSGLADARKILGNTAGALEIYEEILRTYSDRPNLNVHFGKAEILVAQGRYSEIDLDAISALTTTKPEDKIRKLYILAYTLEGKAVREIDSTRASDNYQKALLVYDGIIAERSRENYGVDKPLETDAIFGRIRVLAKLGSFDQALEAIDQLLTNTGLTDYQQSLVRLEKISVYIIKAQKLGEAGNVTEAEKMYVDHIQPLIDAENESYSGNLSGVMDTSKAILTLKYYNLLQWASAIRGGYLKEAGRPASEYEPHFDKVIEYTRALKDQFDIPSSIFNKSVVTRLSFVTKFDLYYSYLGALIAKGQFAEARGVADELEAIVNAGYGVAHKHIYLARINQALGDGLCWNAATEQNYVDALKYYERAQRYLHQVTNKTEASDMLSKIYIGKMHIFGQTKKAAEYIVSQYGAQAASLLPNGERDIAKLVALYKSGTQADYDEVMRVLQGLSTEDRSVVANVILAKVGTEALIMEQAWKILGSNTAALNALVTTYRSGGKTAADAALAGLSDTQKQHTAQALLTMAKVFMAQKQYARARAASLTALITLNAITIRDKNIKLLMAQANSQIAETYLLDEKTQIDRKIQKAEIFTRLAIEVLDGIETDDALSIKQWRYTKLAELYIDRVESESRFKKPDQYYIYLAQAKMVIGQRYMLRNNGAKSAEQWLQAAETLREIESLEAKQVLLDILKLLQEYYRTSGATAKAEEIAREIAALSAVPVEAEEE